MNTEKRHGVVPIPRLIAKMDHLRKMIREQGTPAVQEALDAVEPTIDFLYDRRHHARQLD